MTREEFLTKRLAERSTVLEDLQTALRRIASLGEKNVPKYAQEIAREALQKASVRL